MRKKKETKSKSKWAVSGFSEAPVAPILLLRKRLSVSMHYVNLKNDIYLAIYTIDSKDWICATKTIKLISVVLQRSNKLIQYSKKQPRYEELESIIRWFIFISLFSSNEQQMILLLKLRLKKCTVPLSSVFHLIITKAKILGIFTS